MQKLWVGPRLLYAVAIFSKENMSGGLAMQNF